MSNLDTPHLTQKRPVFLLVLCILTFINTGFSFLGAIASLISGPLSSDKLIEAKVEMAQQAGQMKDVGFDGVAGILDKIYKITEATNRNFYLVNLTNILIVLIGALGAFLMLQGKKLGFHAYIIYCLLASSQLYFFVSAKDIPTFLIVFMLAFSGIWIFLYSRNLKWMK